jgi:hypothetical protein
MEYTDLPAPQFNLASNELIFGARVGDRVDRRAKGKVTRVSV